jgi:dCMP deaminase
VNRPRISRDRMLMEIAGIMAQRSTCSRSSVGALLAIQGRILTTGYNGTPAGMPHCDHTCICADHADQWKRVKGRETLVAHLDACPVGLPCTQAVHAEANAVAYAARHGVSVEGCDAFVTMSPCGPCAQLLINAGVVRVVYDRAYRDLSSILLLDAAGVDVVKYGS